MPATRYEFYRKLYEKRATTTDHPDDYLPEHVGLQPYITMEVFGRLKAAFREYRHLREQHQPTAPVEHAIVFYAGWLGHYVADGSQPLHTTIQYNGWTGPNPNNYTTQHKIHALFETTYVDENITAKDFSSQVHAPEHLTDPFHQYIAYLRDSNQKVETVYALEKAGGFTGKGTPEARTFTTQRLAAGSQMLLNFWYTAWQDSAINPEPPANKFVVSAACGDSRPRLSVERSSKLVSAGNAIHISLLIFVATNTPKTVALLRTLPEIVKSASDTSGCSSASTASRSLTSCSRSTSHRMASKGMTATAWDFAIGNGQSRPGHDALHNVFRVLPVQGV